VLNRAVDIAADDIRTRRALPQAPVMRGYAETLYQAKSWSGQVLVRPSPGQAKSWAKARRACARIEATTLGLDIRFVVTSLAMGSAEHIYDTLYCARGQAENLIKMHKRQLASDRASCRSPLATIRLLALQNPQVSAHGHWPDLARRVYSRTRGRDFVVVPLIKNNFEGGTDGFGTN